MQIIACMFPFGIIETHSNLQFSSFSIFNSILHLSLSLPQSTSSSLESVNSQSLWQRLPRSLPLPFLCLSSCLLGLLASASPVSFRVLSLYPPFLRSLQHSSVYMLCSPPPSSSHLSIFHYSSATILHCALAKKRFCKNPMGKKEKGHCRLAVREEE